MKDWTYKSLLVHFFLYTVHCIVFFSYFLVHSFTYFLLYRSSGQSPLIDRRRDDGGQDRVGQNSLLSTFWLSDNAQNNWRKGPRETMNVPEGSSIRKVMEGEGNFRLTRMNFFRPSTNIFLAFCLAQFIFVALHKCVFSAPLPTYFITF